MTNKPNDVRVSRELLERAANAIEKHHGSLSWVIASELRALLAQPADQQGEQMAITELRHIFDSNKGADQTLVINKKLAAQLLAAQPATAKVVLPESRNVAPYDDWAEGWNACLDEVSKLNGGQS